MLCGIKKSVFLPRLFETYQMAAVVQLVEQRIVVPCVVGSSPINRPKGFKVKKSANGESRLLIFFCNYIQVVLIWAARHRRPSIRPCAVGLSALTRCPTHHCSLFIIHYPTHARKCASIPAAVLRGKLHSSRRQHALFFGASHSAPRRRRISASSASSAPSAPSAVLNHRPSLSRGLRPYAPMSFLYSL